MSLYVNIEKKLGAFNLKVAFSAENETLALLGPSGCGKSLTLKCIAGIEKPDRGQIILDGVTLFDSGKKSVVLQHQANGASQPTTLNGIKFLNVFSCNSNRTGGWV